MKYETLILQAVFIVCLLVCVLTFGAMITREAAAREVVATTAATMVAAQSG